MILTLGDGIAEAKHKMECQRSQENDKLKRIRGSIMLFLAGVEGGICSGISVEITKNLTFSPDAQM